MDATAMINCRRRAAVRGARAGFWLSLSAAVTGAAALAFGAPSASWVPPATLRDTGLYSDWATKTVAPGTLLFSPQYPLWSDGATKTRWMRLPKGTFIDARNPDIWRFPVGARFWKEFRFGRRAETRFIEHGAEGWRFASYAWNDDETEATLVPEAGLRKSVEIREGVRHAIPSRADCRVCHEAGPVHVLGVTALQLSSARDPNAPHAEPHSEAAVDLDVLVSRRLVQGLPASVTSTPPRIAAPTPLSRAALGYLNANCGGCHTGSGELSSLQFALNYTLNRPANDPAPAMATAVDKPSKFRVPGMPDAVNRLCSGHPDASVVVQRMASRNPLVQMPPLGTQLVDEEALRLIKRWIAEDLTPSAAPADAGVSQR
jgi:hypothetical protein